MEDSAPSPYLGYTSPDVVDGVATCDQHKRSDASVRLVSTVQQIHN